MIRPDTSRTGLRSLPDFKPERPQPRLRRNPSALCERGTGRPIECDIRRGSANPEPSSPLDAALVRN